MKPIPRRIARVLVECKRAATIPPRFVNRPVSSCAHPLATPAMPSRREPAMQTAVLEIDRSFPHPLLGEPLINALILDDSKFDRRRIQRISRDMGLPILLDEVASITALRAILDEDSFDLIILDYRLTEGDGLQALALVRTHPAQALCATIMLAGGDDPDVARQALLNGCSDYLSKSQLTAQGLRRAVMEALDRAERAAHLGRATSPMKPNGGGPEI